MPNVGIGTTNPALKLDARGTNAKATTAATQNILQVGSTDASPLALRLGIKTDATAGNRYATIDVDDAGTSRPLFLQPSTGYVGIGTTSITGALTVNSTTTNGAGAALWAESKRTSASPNYGVYAGATGAAPGDNYGVYAESIGASTGTNYGGYFSASGAATANYGLVVASGNVGIGTITPARQLHVNGAMRLVASTTPASPVAGDIFIDSAASNALKYYNGSTWVSLTSGGGGATNIDGLSDAITNSTNMFMGTNAGTSLSTGTENFAAGINAGQNISSGSTNIAIGTNAGLGITTQSDNVAVGVGTLYGIASTSNNRNTAVGSQAMFNNNTGVGAENTALGFEALKYSSGNNNVAAGAFAMSDNSTGSQAVVIGHSAGSGNTGNNNSIIGYSAGTNISGADNVLIGKSVFFNNGVGASAARNVVIGSEAGATNTVRTAVDNVIIGYNAGNAITSADNNVLIGKDAGSSLTTGDSNILIGSGASAPAVGTNNFLNIGNAIFATGMTGTLAAPAGSVGIGTTAPRSSLDVSGGAISGTAAVSNATGTINFLTSNLQYTTSNCGAFNLHNMKDGSSYTFVVQGATSATCSFSAFSGAGSGALTMHLPPDHGATTASKHTLYSFVVLGTHVYASWVPGY